MEIKSRKKVFPVVSSCIQLLPEDNPKVVDDSGYVPLEVLVSRFERSGQLKDMYERLANPNSSLDKVVEDFSALEQCGDSLEVMAFAKSALDRIKACRPDIVEKVVPDKIEPSLKSIRDKDNEFLT